WAKRSSKEKRSRCAGDTKKDSLIQAAAPNAQASTPQSSAAFPDNPMRRRGKRPAIAVSNVIASPIPPSPGSPSPSQGLFDQPKQHTTAELRLILDAEPRPSQGIRHRSLPGGRSAPKALSKPHQAIGRFQVFTTIDRRKWGLSRRGFSCGSQS